MVRSKSDISNSAIRIFLQDVGRFYNEARGFEPFGAELLKKKSYWVFLIISIVAVVCSLIKSLCLKAT